MSFRLSPIFYLVSLFISPCHAMLVAGHAVVSPDQGRYIAFLWHYHESDGWGHEARQLDELVAVCKEGISGGKNKVTEPAHPALLQLDLAKLVNRELNVDKTNSQHTIECYLLRYNAKPLLASGHCLCEEHAH